MNRARDMYVAEALNEAIWIRDNAENIDREMLMDSIMRLAKYKVFSARQISAITNGLVSHTTVSRVLGKHDRTGGNLNVGTLDILRNILYSRADGDTDYRLIHDAVGSGTSQGMVAKITGISQSAISKNIREVK
jgi:transposase